MSFLQNTSMHSDDLSFLQDRSVIGSTPDIPPASGESNFDGGDAGRAGFLQRGDSTESMMSRGSPRILPGLKRKDTKANAELDEFMALEEYAQIGGSTPDLTRETVSTEV